MQSKFLDGMDLTVALIQNFLFLQVHLHLLTVQERSDATKEAMPDAPLLSLNPV